MSETRSIDTPHGEARLETFRARSPFVTLLLSHGAGGGTGARDLQALARELPGQGANVVLLEQPWRLAGRKVATPPPTLDAALMAAAKSLRSRTPLVGGGRSAAARARGPRRWGVPPPPGRGPVPGRHPGSAPSAVCACRSRCTRRAGRRSRGSRS